MRFLAARRSRASYFSFCGTTTSREESSAAVAVRGASTSALSTMRMGACELAGNVARRRVLGCLPSTLKGISIGAPASRWTPCRAFSSHGSTSSTDKLLHTQRWGIGPFGIFGVFLFGTYFAKGQYERILAEKKREKTHEDHSVVTIKVRRHRGQNSNNSTSASEKHLTQGELPAEVVAQLLRDRRANLQMRGAVLADRVKSKLREETDVVWESEFYARIPVFRNWYYAYKTQWKLLQVAGQSLVTRATSLNRPGEKTSDLVAADLQEFIERKYELLLLQPEISDPRVKTAFGEALKFLAAEYMVLLRDVEVDFARAMREAVRLEKSKVRGEKMEECAGTAEKDSSSSRTTGSEDADTGDGGNAVSRDPGSDGVEVELDGKVVLDWASQLNKVKSIPARFERSPSLLAGVAGITTAGAVAKAATAAGAKVAGSTAVGGLASGAGAGIGSAAAKAGAAMLPVGAKPALGSKLIAPFLTPEVLGALAGGPAGLLVGVAVDVTLNHAVKLAKKQEFDAEVRRSLDAMKEEWNATLGRELEIAVEELCTAESFPSSK